MMVNVGLNDQVCVVRSLGPQGWGWGAAEESEWGPPMLPAIPFHWACS